MKADFWSASARVLSVISWLLILNPGNGEAAVPVESALRAVVSEDVRVATVAWRLQTSGRPICPRLQNVSGLIVQHASQYGSSARKTVGAILNLRDLPTIVGIVPGSAADKADFRVGDEIVSVDGQGLVTADQISDREEDTIHAEILIKLRRSLDKGQAVFVLRREGLDLTIALSGTPACISDVEVDLRPGLNSKADGQSVVIWQGLLNFVRDDNELAFAIAHELAHNILSHRDGAQKKAVTWFRGAGQIRAEEDEADYFALYLVARAGYDISAAAVYMSRYGKSVPYFLMSNDHSNPEVRAKYLMEECFEINEKKMSGIPLIPDRLAR